MLSALSLLASTLALASFSGAALPHGRLSAFRGSHLGELQRVNLFRSRSGGKRRK